MKKDKTIKATHYFGECSMGNFWNTYERKKVESDFKIIKDHGFNTIILIIPWSSFQTKYDPISYDNKIINRLDYLLSKIKDFQFDLIVRIGYLWSNSNENVKTFGRYQMFMTSPKLQNAWADYIKKIESRIIAHNIKYSFFLCWEDWYWSVVRVNERISFENRIKLAKTSGFQNYIKENYNIEDLKSLYNLELDNFQDIAMPLFNEDLYQESFFYFDNFFINKILTITKLSLINNNLIYEHRIDPELTASKTLDSNINKKLINLDALYYHPKIGEISSEKLTLDESIAHFKRTVESFRINSLNVSPPFIDQLNFHVANPDYPNFGRIPSSIHNDFILGIADTIKNETSGYGIWGIFDWTNDKIYNGAFELDTNGWLIENGHVEDNKLYLYKNGKLKQKIKDELKSAIVEIKYLEIKNDTNITICDKETILEKNSTEIKVNVGDINEIKIENNGELIVKKISAYNHIFSNGMLTRKRKERKTSSALKQINNYLS